MAVTAPGSRLVVKVGGEVIASEELPAVAKDVRALVAGGAQVAVVHGGGPQVSALAHQLGLATQKIGGRRVTDPATLDVMKMVVCGQINVDLCAALGAAGVQAVGLHGASALAVRAEKRPPRVVTGGGDLPVDLGLVGDIKGFHMPLFETLLQAGYVPVLACLGADAQGNVYNVNADLVANQLAAALKAARLFLVTSVPGVLRDLRDPNSRLPVLTVLEARRAIAEGVVTGGMIPKLEEAIAVLGQGVGAIHIVGKLRPGDLLREAEVPGSVGTALVSD